MVLEDLLDEQSEDGGMVIIEYFSRKLSLNIKYAFNEKT
tara:strand:- start:942 stop:1058 length:117 start_codon:yes stop_codon:yes gene_type:complete